MIGWRSPSGRSHTEQHRRASLYRPTMTTRRTVMAHQQEPQSSITEQILPESFDPLHGDGLAGSGPTPASPPSGRPRRFPGGLPRGHPSGHNGGDEPGDPAKRRPSLSPESEP